MATEKTQYLDWDKPVFPSDNLAVELDALFDAIDFDVNELASGWSVSDDGTEVLLNPSDLNFGSGLTVTDDGDGSVTLEGAASYTDSDAISAVNAETSLSVDITGDADTVDGKNIYKSPTAPTSPQDGDIWFETQ